MRLWKISKKTGLAGVGASRLLTLELDEQDRSLVEPSPPPGPEVSGNKSDADLDNLTVDDALECVETFHSCFGVLYPILQFESIRANLSTLLRAVKRSLWSQPTNPGDCGLLELFKILVAIALATRAGGHSELSKVLYKSIEPIVSAAAFCRRITHNFRTLLLLAVPRTLPFAFQRLMRCRPFTIQLRAI